MGFILKYSWLVLFIFIFSACSSDDNVDKDEQKPTISINYDGGFPKSCAVLKKGNTYNFRAMATDNMALATYSFDIHHNFDQHTHDDQGEQCDMDPIKQAGNPWIFMENYPIGNDLTVYEINISITVPNDIDTGDYHCTYSITDKTGWQSRTSIGIKITE